MILISHRGNTEGPTPELENKPEYILETMRGGFEVEIDVWLERDGWYLGHDKPQYRIPLNFLKLPDLWIHSKNYDAFQVLLRAELNTFYHTDEDYVLTGHKYIWAYPGKPGGVNTICVMPEWNDFPSVDLYTGVCSDYIGKYKRDQDYPI